MREILVPRHIAMYLGKKYLNLSNVRIGQLFGERDHATVMHAVGKIEKNIHNDQQLIREIRALEPEIGLDR